MTTAAQPAPRGQRSLLSFSVEGLPPREELLFKSLVRLLDHRTHQHWDWKAGEADLRVVGEQLHAAADAPSVPVLAVGQVDPQRGGHFLALPLHADALEQTLNRLGAMVVHARGLGLVAAEAGPGEDDAFRLLRWPPAALLEAPHRIRLATLMTGRPTSLGVLRQRSGLATQDCLDFIADLRRSGLLENVPAAAPSGSFANSIFPSSLFPDSLLPGSTPPDSRPAASRPALRETVQPGLLARIRNRLGLLAPGAR